MNVANFLKIFTSIFLVIFLVTNIVALYYIGIDNFKEVIFSDMLRNLLIMIGSALPPTIVLYKSLNQKRTIF